MYWVIYWLNVAALALLALPFMAHAQEPAVGTSFLGWTQDDADAPSLTYLLGVSGATPYVMPAPVTCTPSNGTLHDCRVRIADLGLAQGQYLLTVQARRTVEAVDFDSPESGGLNIVRAEVANTPTTLVIIVEVP